MKGVNIQRLTNHQSKGDGMPKDLVLTLNIAMYEVSGVVNPCAMCYFYDNASSCKQIKLGSTPLYEVCDRSHYFMLKYYPPKD